MNHSRFWGLLSSNIKQARFFLPKVKREKIIRNFSQLLWLLVPLASSIFWTHARIAQSCPLGICFGQWNESRSDVSCKIQRVSAAFLSASAKTETGIRKQSPSVWVLVMDIQREWEITHVVGSHWKFSTACYHSTTLPILTDMLHEDLGPTCKLLASVTLITPTLPWNTCLSAVVLISLLSGNLHTVGFMTIIFLVTVKFLTLFSLKNDTLAWVAEYRIASSLSHQLHGNA